MIGDAASCTACPVAQRGHPPPQPQGVPETRCASRGHGGAGRSCARRGPGDPRAVTDVCRLLISMGGPPASEPDLKERTHRRQLALLGNREKVPSAALYAVHGALLQQIDFGPRQ